MERTNLMRIDKLLANMGYGSRKEVKNLLKKSVVTVNDEIVKDGKHQVDPVMDQIEIYGERVVYKQYIYLMMNKPKGVISATEDELDETVIDLLSPEHAHFQPFPVGRLDKDTTGLMLLTNDGKLAHEITSPKKRVDKTYLVRLNEPITENDIRALEAGVELEDGYVTMPAIAKLIEGSNNCALRLTIQEGKFHQVKRMMESRGRKVISLKRERIGPIHLDPSLMPGQYRELNEQELSSLGVIDQ